MEKIDAPNWGEKYSKVKLMQMKKSRIRWERYDGLMIDIIKLLVFTLCIQLIIRWFQ